MSPRISNLGTFARAKEGREACRLTMRLSDAALHKRQTKALGPNHRPLLDSPKTLPRDRSNRLLGLTIQSKSLTPRATHPSHCDRCAPRRRCETPQKEGRDWLDTWIV